MRILLLFLMGLLLTESADAQVCNGQLGENIFESGTFGTGTQNIITENPNISPGYTYTDSFPQDGQYILLTNSRFLNFLPETWLTVGDKSSNENGYFMLVNASFSPDIFYQQTIDNLCPNTTYTFNASIINMVKRNVLNHIKPNVAFLLDGQILGTTGEIPQSENWITYRFSFTTGPEQTSLSLSLRNNAPGGIGNDLALDNIEFKPCGPKIATLPDTTFCGQDTIRLINSRLDTETQASQFIQWQTKDSMEWVNLPSAEKFSLDAGTFAAGTKSFRYLLAGSPNSLDNPFCRVASNEFQVQILDESFEIDLGADKEINLGDSVLLSANPTTKPDTVYWVANERALLKEKYLFPHHSGYFKALAISENGCPAEDSLFIDLNYLRLIDFPDAFSPNKDGINDFYKPSLQSPNVLEIQSFMIYNRWGNLVFRNKHQDAAAFKGWDGTIDGSKAPSGVYVVQCQVQFLDGQIRQYVHDFILVR